MDHTSGVNSTTSTSQATTRTQTSKANSDKSDFMKLLVAELQYQDPMNPTTDREYIGQLAQFQTLDLMQKLSDTMSAMADMQQLGQGAALIGKTIEAKQDGSEELVTGVVTEVGIESGVAILRIGDTTVPLHNVIRVTETPAAAAASASTASTAVETEQPQTGN